MNEASKAKQQILTVVVPTRNRADTLVHCLHTITAQTNPNIEILVSDNFSGPEVKQAVDTISDKRLRYIRTPQTLGMSEHWNFLMDHVKGDWVTIVGDDDGLILGAVDKFFALAEKHPNIKAITAANCFYRWPTNDNDTTDAKLSVIEGKGYEIRNSYEYLKKTMNGQIAAMPTIYTGGFVRKDLIDEIRSKSPNGNFFQSIIPDVYSGMAITSVADEYIYTAEAWGISGSSKHSNGRQHKDKTREEMKKLDFYNESKMKFLPSLGDGAVESMQILLYESFLQSQHLRKDNMGVTLQQQMEISMLTANKRIRAKVEEYCREIAKLNNIEFDPILKVVNGKRPARVAKRQLRKLMNHIPGVKKKNRKIYTDMGMNNVYDAAKEIQKLLA